MSRSSDLKLHTKDAAHLDLIVEIEINQLHKRERKVCQPLEFQETPILLQDKVIYS